jgi:hypothetical protein
VNTIFCGGNAEGRQTGWYDGAILSEGRYMNIDQNQKIVEIPTPQDAVIAQLGVQLNKTYLPYGTMGQAGQARQSAQDVNAGNSSQSVLATRSLSKVNAFYCNDGWDLVDAITNGKCKLEDVKTEDLPEDMRKLDQAGRKAKVESARKEREDIQKKILKLNQEREAFLAAERKKNSGVREQTLEQAISKAIRAQAARNNFTFE